MLHDAVMHLCFFHVTLCTGMERRDVALGTGDVRWRAGDPRPR